jgi:hypothetical protein
MDQEKKQFIEFSTEKQEVAVQPGGELVITGIDFEKVTVDIVDTDVLIGDPGTGGLVTLLGLAIFLFDEDVVPLISINGVYIPPNLLLSKVGEIGNLTMQEFVAVSSLLEEDLKTSEVESEEADMDFEAAAEILAMITESIESMAQAQAIAEKVEVSKDDGKYERKYIDDEGDKFSVAPKQPPHESPGLAGASEAPAVTACESRIHCKQWRCGITNNSWWWWFRRIYVQRIQRCAICNRSA